MSNRMIDKVNKAMPYLINKTGIDYEALIGKETYTEEVEIVDSEDYNCGAICNELEFAREFIENVIQQNDTDDMEGEYLDEVVDFFVSLYRFTDELDSSLRDRLHSLIRRNSNPKWMTSWSFKDVFSYYFDESYIYVIENPIESTEDEILNGDFEDTTGIEFDNWTRNEAGSSTVTEENTENFEGDNSVDIFINAGDSASIQQTTPSLSADWYKVEFFHKDDGNATEDPIKVSIMRSGDSYYWDFDDQEWQTGVHTKSFASTTVWKEDEFYFELTDSRTITLKIWGESTTTVNYNTYLDIVKLGAIKTYPSIKVLIISEGSSAYSMAFWDNGADPVGGTDYDYASFLDFEYIEGPGGPQTGSYYDYILDLIKVGGTKGIFEFYDRTP